MDIKPYLCTANLMVGIAQLVRVSDCGPEGRGFDPHFPPKERQSRFQMEAAFFIFPYIPTFYIFEKIYR